MSRRTFQLILGNFFLGQVISARGGILIYDLVDYENLGGSS